MTARLAVGAGLASTRTRSLADAYASLVLVYVAALLFLYPYGVPLGGEASVRLPDLLGLLCLFAGALALILRERLRPDLLFLAIAGPFVFLELAAPVIGAVGLRQPLDAVSTIRMAILWLPMIFLAMLAPPVMQPTFERRLRVLLAASLLLNLPYAVVQIAVGFGYAPEWMAFTRLLEPWAVEGHFDVIQGIRPAGFFANTTALSVFGIACLSYFYARYIACRAAPDLWYAVGAFLLVVLTASRAAVAAALLIVAVGWIALGSGRKLLVLGLFAAAVVAILAVVEATVGIDQAFHRFTRLVESGVLEDTSLGKRLFETWPAALAVARDFPLGTLISAPRIAELIDSGYLNYYMQGRWVFLATVALLLGGQLLVGFASLRRPERLSGGLIILFLGIFLAGAMVVSNPVRSPTLIALLVFAFWKLSVERDTRWVRGVGLPPGAP